MRPVKMGSGKSQMRDQTQPQDHCPGIGIEVVSADPEPC